jgi:putative aldouronate transport system substrate-binding protein
MTISHTGDLIAPDHPAIRALEEITGYKIKLEHILNANYNEMLNTRLASRNLPGIVVITGNTLPVVQATQYGAFWDITEIFDLYPNLARANRGIMDNISIGGHYFGIYRERPWPRSGMIYRSDWLQNLGLSKPTNLEELFDVLYAFTHNDPTGTGQNTFGMNWTGFHMGPFHNLAVMHGAPNRFGLRNGVLTPWFEWDEFFEAMLYSRRLFDAGIINQDFAATSTGDWALAFGRGQAGWHIDVADEASRAAVRMRDNGLMTQEEFNQGLYVGVMGAVANNQGQTFVFPQNDGHQGFVGITTVGARTLEDLHHHLTFLDRLNTPEAITILNWGAENVNWTRNNDGTITVIQADQIPNGWNVVEGLNQFRMLDDLGAILSPNPYQRAHLEVYRQIQPYAVLNPVTPIAIMSPTWTSRQSSLNQIIDDAVINFVMGNIEQAGFRSEVARWYNEGGQQALNELQAAYDASK